MENAAGTLQAKEPALAAAVNRQDKFIEELTQLVGYLRGILNIQENEEKLDPPPPKLIPKNLIKERALNFEDLSERLACQIRRLAPVLEAVKDI